MARHLHVEIISTRRAALAAVLLHNTICICRELSRAPEVQNLQISFVNNNWEGFRDDDSPKKSGWRQRVSKSLERRRSGGNRPLPHSTDQWHSIDDDIEVALQPFGLLRNVKQCIINLPPLLEAEDGHIAAVRYLQEIMTSKSSADDSECDEDLTRLWQSDVQQLLSLGADLELQDDLAHEIARESTGEAASRVAFLRMKLCIKELDARFGVSSA